jgi:hypothetical protein
MNINLVKILVVAVTAVLVMGALGLGVAFAQDPTPNNPFPPGGMMGGYWNQQGNWDRMSAMHNWMTSTGGMHALVWDALSNALGLTTDELYAELNRGKSLAQLAEEKGLDRAALVTELENAHQDGLAQAVADGVLTQEQADAMLSQMAGNYEWMIDNMGAGYGMMGGSFGRLGSKGQFDPGGCHGNFAPSASQATP